MQNFTINGLQHVGIGTKSLDQSFNCYKNLLKFTTAIIKAEKLDTNDMKFYTNNQIFQAKLSLLFNFQAGGSGIEIWQYTDRKQPKNNYKPILGDIGIFASKIKTNNIINAYNYFKKNYANNIKSEIVDDIMLNKKTFYISDHTGLIFQIIEVDDLINDKYIIGGIGGITLGVSDIEKSKKFYQKILNYDNIIHEEITSVANNKIHRVLLQNCNIPNGVFGNLLGQHQLELVQSIDRKPNKITKNKYWGDCGFIHFAYEIDSINKFRVFCKQNNIKITAGRENELSFNRATCHYSYISDPDEIPIEFIESTHIPIFKLFNIKLPIKFIGKKPLLKFMLNVLSKII